MVNYNGTLISHSDPLFKAGNRAFLYGDQLFETLLYKNSTLKFWEDHYFRMMGTKRNGKQSKMMKFKPICQKFIYFINM